MVEELLTKRFGIRACTYLTRKPRQLMMGFIQWRERVQVTDEEKAFIRIHLWLGVLC